MPALRPLQPPVGAPCAEVSAREAGYLLALHRLQREQAPLTQAALARAMGVSAPTALEMVRRLRSLGLVEPKALALTSDGTSAALACASRYHAAHILTNELLGIDAESSGAEIELLAPKLSAGVVRRLNARRPGGRRAG